jgi:hypothetical protein
MKMVIACVAFAFLSFGCAMDRAPSLPQDETESGSTEALSTDSLGVAGPAAALDCSAPELTCRAFCTCQYRECLSSGGIPRLCRAEADGCFRDLCF